jgi:hypothetical protein
MFGIVIPVPRKYESIALDNVRRLRGRFGLECPIEIWEVGEEVGSETRRALESIGGVRFRNALEYPIDPSHWKGFQVKAFAASRNGFDEFLLCDADVRFLQDPSKILRGRSYRETGTYFFRDLAKWKFRDIRPGVEDHFRSLEYFSGRRDWLRGLLPKEPSFFPREWHYMFEDGIPASPVAEAYMEAGAVYFDRRRHADTLEAVYRLNDDHETTYRWVWGDKETWWIACCMTSKPFAMHAQYPIQPPKMRLTHFLGALPFFTQK